MEEKLGRKLAIFYNAAFKELKKLYPYDEQQALNGAAALMLSVTNSKIILDMMLHDSPVMNDIASAMAGQMFSIMVNGSSIKKPAPKRQKKKPEEGKEGKDES